MESLTNLLDGADLDAALAAERHLNGAPGFYMAMSKGDAEYFAIRRGGNIITFEIEDDAVEELIEHGAQRQPIPMTPMSARFEADELFVPVEVFPVFNSLRMEGRVHVTL